jgi:hypothetical protein
MRRGDIWGGAAKQKPRAGGWGRFVAVPREPPHDMQTENIRYVEPQGRIMYIVRYERAKCEVRDQTHQDTALKRNVAGRAPAVKRCTVLDVRNTRPSATSIRAHRWRSG